MRLIKAHRASEILLNILCNTSVSIKWLVPRNICPVVIEVFETSGRTYCLVDINHSGDINLDDIDFLNGDYGVVYVEPYGLSTKIASLIKRIRDVNENVIFIKDKCLSRPVLTEDDQLCDAVLFSTGYSKYVDLRDGGFCFIDNNLNFSKWKSFRSDENKYRDRYQASHPYSTWHKEDFMEVILKNLAVVDKSKHENNLKIKRKISQLFNYDEISSTWRYTIYTDKAEELSNYLVQNKLLFSRYYTCALHPVMNKQCNACIQSEHVINIFNDFRMSL